MRFPNNYIRKTLYLLALVFVSQLHSQTPAELDTITRQYKTKGDLQEAMKFNVNALKNYQNQNHKEGIATAYINIGNLLCTLNRNKESIHYLDEAKKEIGEIKDPILQSRLYSEYGRNYASLRLLKQSNVILDKAINYAWKIPSKKQREYYLYFNYAWKWDNFDNMNELDSMYNMQRKCMKISSEPLIYIKVADYYVVRKIHLDSAEYYLNKALPLAQTGKYPLNQKGMALLTFGNLYREKKEYEKALEYYFQSLDVFQTIKGTSNIRTTYKDISKAYHSLNDTEKAREYFAKYTFLNDEIIADERKALNIAVEKSLQEKEDHEKEEKNKLYLLIFAIVVLFIGLGYFIIKLYNKKEKHKDELIEEKSIETDQLKKKINVSFEEVAKLAKNNDPFFLTRFKEVYPEFYESLISQHPNITTHDVKFSAYLKLDLSSKEIAQYENITLRAVETKKYRLKKKLDLPADVDLQKWIIDL